MSSNVDKFLDTHADAPADLVDAYAFLHAWESSPPQAPGDQPEFDIDDERHVLHNQPAFDIDGIWYDQSEFDVGYEAHDVWDDQPQYNFPEDIGSRSVKDVHSNADFDAMPYGQRLQAILRSQYPPDVINIGSVNFTSGGTQVEQTGFFPMTGEQLRQLARLLQTQPSITHLNLSGNMIGCNGMHNLAASIAMNTILQRLYLSKNELGSIGGKHIAGALVQLTGLKTLDLSENELGHTGGKHIAGALVQLTGLKTLDLSGNTLMGGEDVAEALSQLTGLQSLDLSGNELGPTAGEHVACFSYKMETWNGALRQLTGLQSLYLSGNGLGPTGGEYVARVLRQLTGLQTLDLSRNELGGAEARMNRLFTYSSLWGALMQLTGLHTLDLSYNELGPMGREPISLMNQLSPHGSSSLWGNKLGKDVAGALMQLTGLQTLHLRGNNFDISTCCSFASSFIFLPNLRDFDLDIDPASCIRSVHWHLAVPPDEIIARGWMSVIKFLQAGPTVPVFELRLMFIGDGEVGKTSLFRAFTAEGHRAGRIPKMERTVGIDLSDYLFPARPGIGPEIHLQVCDFAGQEIYHLSHTLQFTRRCLYMLMWTTHKYSESNEAQALDIEDIMGPLKRWLQLLAANVPEACVLVVGTHCRVDPGAFAYMQVLVDACVKEETERLRFIAQQEAEATRRVLKLQEEEVAKFCLEIEAESSAFQMLHVPNRRSLSLQVCEQFKFDVAALNPPPNRSFRRKAQSLLEAMQQLTRTKLRLGRLHGVHDGSQPAAPAAVAHLKLVSDHSFAVDSVEGVGITELLNALEATCRDKNALPFMGEEVPVSWLHVKEALKLEAVSKVVGDCVMSVSDAAAKVQSALRLQQLDRVRAMRVADVQRCLEFWALLGRGFVYQGHFVRVVSVVIELMKPLVHHSVTGRKFMEEFCMGSFDGMHHCLHQLQHTAILDIRLLSHFKAWASASPEAQRSLLDFFKESFMVSDLSRGSALGSSSCLITARLCDSTDADRQRRAAAEAAAIEAESKFLAVYSIPSAHIGLIARMQAIIKDVQPYGVHLHVTCSHSHICISLESGSHMRCYVALRSLEDVFRSPKLANLKDKVPNDTFSHAFVICSSDDGLFLFAVRCADAIMHSGAFSAHFECWLPVFPFHLRALLRADWVPKCEDWALVGSGANKMRISQIVCSNSDSPVLCEPPKKLREVVPRRPPIFMSHTCIRGGNKTSGDGTGEFCQRLKDRLQERLMCTVWFDRDEMGGLAAFTDLMKEGVAHASAFVVCLSPLYLTRPNCLRELMWAMDICEKDHSKILRIIPTHPSVSFAGCKSIIDLAAAGCGAHVILPANDNDPKLPPLLVEELKGHRLSSVAISLLKRLVGSRNQGTNAEWLKLQPWLSDVEGENWEEASKAWYGLRECESVEMESCFGALALDLQAAVLGDRHASPVDWLVDIEDDQLCSEPRSQEYTEAPDVALLRTCFPQTLNVFADEKDAVKLMMLGLRDTHVINCVEHRLIKTSAVTSHANPLDPVFRMAAHMSGVNFEAAAQRLKTIRKKYALPLLFLELDQLLLIISCPKNVSLNALNSSSVVTDKDVLDCIVAGKPCGALQHINCPVDLNAVFAKAKQKFSDKNKQDFNSIVAAYFAESSEVDAPAVVQSNRLYFLQWLMQERETHVVCRVEGTDDVLLVDALMDWSEHVTRSPTVAWNDFSYKARASARRVEMQIRLANMRVAVEPDLRTGVFAFLLDGSVHTWNDRISSMFPDAHVQWTDVTDGDLKLHISVLSSGAKPSSSVRPCIWKSRGIENMLLHPTSVLWLVRADLKGASDGFREIFKTMSDNFFGSAGLNSHSIVSCAKMAGPGWIGWHEIPFEESKLPQHSSMTRFLKRIVDAVLASDSSVASAMLVFFEFFREVCPISEVEKEQKSAVKVLLPKYANIFNLMSKDCSDVGLFQQQLQTFSGADGSKEEDRRKALWCMGHALIDTQQAIMILGQGAGQSLVPKDARTAFWQRNKPLAALATAGPACFIHVFPRFLCFLHCLCCANGIDASIKAAARSCTSAVFRLLCAIPFGMEDDAHVRPEGLNSIMFRSQTAMPCSGYVPRSRSAGNSCLCCEQPDDCHVLKHDCQRCDTDNEIQFMRVACRVGSMGWDSHPLMQLVHDVRHLGSNVAESGVVSGFLESTVASSQSSYRQHLHHHIFGAHPFRRDFVPCDLCESKSLALDSLPQIVRDEVQRLQRERREEFQGFIDAIDGHFAPNHPQMRNQKQQESELQQSRSYEKQLSPPLKRQRE